MPEARPLKAKETFFMPNNVAVHAGDVHWSDDPLVKGREHMFESLIPERATANPGELRQVPKRKKTAVKKKVNP